MCLVNLSNIEHSTWPGLNLAFGSLLTDLLNRSVTFIEDFADSYKVRSVPLRMRFHKSSHKEVTE